MFEPIEITYKEQILSVPANQVFGLIASIEEHITIGELYDNPKTTSIAKAYCAAVNYAGGNATNTEMYSMLFDQKSALNVRNTIQALIMIMIPPEHLKASQEEPANEKPKKPRKRS